jgi:serine-type D-Ala-D-Ala carboxypeptidase (penicillin-binding protein 5/6)
VALRRPGRATCTPAHANVPQPVRWRPTALLALTAALIVLGPSSGGAWSTPATGLPSAAPSAPALAPADAETTRAVTGASDGLSVLLVEGATGQSILALDVAERRPLASTTKLVTALVVVDALPAGSLVSVGEEVRGATGSLLGLRPGELWSVEDLLAGLLLRSGNEVATALAVAVAGSEVAFLRRMDAHAATLGIAETGFASASGLEDDDRLSAEELAVIARAVLAEPRLRTIVGQQRTTLAGGTVPVENRNLLVGRLLGATGLKTGFTNAAGFTIVASAERDGRELVAVVLGATSEEERLSVAQRALEHGFASTSLRPVGGTLELRGGRGPVLLTAVPTALTVPRDAEVVLAWPPALRPDDAPEEVALVVGSRSAGATAVVRTDGREVAGGGAGLGAALADGAYAAMRARSLAGALG